MENNWFIINKKHHHGPFCSRDIENFFDLGKINKDTKVWKESFKDWMALEDVQDFSGLFPPELPPIPSFDTVTSAIKVTHASSHIQDQLPELPPAVPSTSKRKVKGASVRRNTASNTFDRKPKNRVVNKTKTLRSIIDEKNTHRVNVKKAKVQIEKAKNSLLKLKVPLKFALSSLTIVFVLVVTYFISGNSKKERSFTKLKRNEFKRLKTHTKRHFKDKLNMDFAFSKKAKSLWASSNISGPATMYLNLKSIDGRVISSGKVIANSKSELKGKAAHFKNFNFIEGTSLPKGEYEATVVAVKKGMKLKVSQMLNERSPANHQLKYKGKVTIYGKSKKQFEERLTRFKRNERLKKNLPLQDRIEKYRTLGALVERIGNIYDKSLKTMKRPGKMRGFETSYGTTVGPILQGIILDNHAQARKLQRKNPVRAKKYLKLLEYGKRIGELASDMVTTTSKFKRLTKSKKAHLKLIFEKKVQDLKSLGLLRLKKLSSQIN